MARFNDVWMETLLHKNDIVSVVSSYVSLRAKGRNLWGLCPFHNEKTPSFSVAPDKQMYYCFGCGAGGGVIQFVMSMERMPYMEAVQLLAHRVGMELPNEVNDAELQQEREKRERLYKVCKTAAHFYHEKLFADEGKAARVYLAKRGLDAGIVKKFGLGYAADAWDDLKNTFLAEGFHEEDMLLAGLLVKNQKTGRVYDAYRNRVLFPIIGTNARVLGFGARAMGDELPKYINTGETPIYSKRRNLYALNMLKGGKTPDLIIVEGYMDVISLYASGIRNAVASLGTSLTEQQARLIKRYVENVYIAYDGDAAGQNATLRGLDILAAQGLQVKVITLPPGMDPDDYARQNGQEAFQSLKDQALTLSAFKLERMALEFDLYTEDGRQDYALKGCAFISTLQPVEQERYYAFLARKTGMALETLKAQGARSAAGERPIAQAPTAPPGRKRASDEDFSERAHVEKVLLRAMLHSREAAEAVLKTGIPLQILFQETVFYELAQRLFETIHMDKNVDMVLLVNELSEEHAQQLAGMTQEQEAELGNVGKYIEDCIRRISLIDVETQIKELRNKAASDVMNLEDKLLLTKQIQELDGQCRRLREESRKGEGNLWN